MVKGQDISSQTLPENLEKVTQEVVFSTGRFTLVLGTDGTFNSITLESGKELIREVSNFNHFTLTLPGQEAISMDNFYTSGDDYVFATSDNRYYASFKITPHPTYLSFDLVDFYGDLPEGSYMELYLGVTDTKVKTLAYNYMVYEFGVDQTKRIRFEHLWERYKGNKKGGFALYTYTNEAEEDESILQAWGNESMPHPKVDGEWNYDRAVQWVEEWKVMFEDQSVMYIAPQNVEELPLFEEYLDKADVTTVNFFTNMWHGGFWPKDKPNWEVDGIFGSQDALKEYSQLQRENNRSINIHYVSGGIGKNDPLYSGENLSNDLASWVDGTLIQAVLDTDTEILFHPKEEWYTIPDALDDAANSFGKLSSPLPTFFQYNYLQVGQELMIIESIEDMGDGTWKFTLNHRGFLSTITSAHQEGTNVKGILLAYNQVFVPENNSELFKTLTTNYASLLNDCQISNALFDGAEIHTFDGSWGFRKFAEQVYEKIDHPVVVRTSNGREPDTGYLEYKINSTKAYLTSPVGDHNKARPSLKLERNSTTNKGVQTPASNLLAANYMLGIQAAHNGRNFSILRPDPMFGITLEEFETYGKTDELLSLLPKWKAASKLLTEEQRQTMMDTYFIYVGRLFASYTTFELRETEDDFFLVPIQMMSQDSEVTSDLSSEDEHHQYFHMKQEDGMYAPYEKVSFGQTLELNNKYHKQSPQFIVRVLSGEQNIVQPRFRIGESFLSVNTMIRATTEHSQYIEYRGGEKAKVYDQNWNLKEEVDVIISGKFEVEAGINTIALESNDNSTAEVELMMFTKGNAMIVHKQNKDAQLADLTVNNVTVPDFENEVYSYNYVLADDATEIPVVNATARHAKANVEVIAASAIPGVTTIIVTAEDTLFKQEYKVYFVTEDGAASNANLAEVYLDGVLYKDFNPAILFHEIEVQGGIFPTVSAFTEDKEATYAIEGDGTFGNTFTITVTSPTGLTKTYSFIIRKEGALSVHSTDPTIKVFKASHQELNIQSENQLNGKMMTIYSISGQKVFERALTGSQEKVNLNLRGLYIVHIYDQNSRSVHKVIF
ncbi:T9SS type A sorting domain-containing protein [Flammeovirga sp. OC4]|uniref:T9SS type A sorting domain-containing protein n=1 Tax=Flammeovirga sp. OC4 TaxID=1382345 RepID=UPI0005C79852|nr:T9SS type A sorting domain-containing protein [Flammeovirga sp. OC4]